MKEKFFTTEQVANILQVHPFTILKFIKQGKLQGIKLGRVYRIKESHVEQFLENQMTKPSKQPKKEKIEEAPEAPTQKTQKAAKANKPEHSTHNDEGEDHYYII